MSKKLVALVLAFALVFSSFTAAFAAEALPVDAQAAVTIGMLKGDTSAGVTNAYLTTAPDRLQAAIMFLRLKGLEQEALAYTNSVNFADADTVKWAGGRNIMAYLKNNPQLGWQGKGGNLFDPNKEMEAKDYYKVMLEALGYKQNTTDVIGDFTYDQTIQFAASKGLTKVAAVANFTVADLATATIEALKATKKDSTVTLIASLVEAGKINAQAAIAAGLYAPAPVALAVESVTTDNLKQLTVKFNKEVKEAGDEDNYSLATSGAAVLDASSDFALQADKKTVVITLTTAAAQQEKIDLTVEDIEAVDGSKIAKTIVEDVELFDKTIPAAVSAAVIGNDTIKVTFSEPIATVAASNFKVDGGEVVIKGIAQANNNTEVNVELFSVLENGSVTIEVGTAAKDYAGYAGLKKSFTLNVVKDEAAPVVVGYKDATPTGVTLVFNEEISLVDGTLANFYHTNTSNTADDVEVDGKELTLDFSTNKMPEGTAYVYVAKEVVADLWDNENAKVAYTVQVTLDKTAPTVTKVEAGDTEKLLEITFSEELDTVSAQTVTNYTILDKDGKEVANKIASATLVEDVVTIEFTEDMVGAYSIVIEKVEDLAGNAIAKVTKAFNISDVTAPEFATDFSAKLYNAGTEDQMLKVSFGEAMAVSGRYSVVDLEKYSFHNMNLSDVKNATIKAVDGNKAVEIALPYDAAVTGTHIFADSQTLLLARVADAAGNVTPELVGEVDVVAQGTVGVDTVELTAKNTVVVTLLDKLTKFSANDFVLFADANSDEAYTTADDVTLAASRISHTINADGVSVVTFTLAANVATDATTLASGYDVAVATKATTASENIYGEALVDGFAQVADDKAAPTAATFNFVNSTTIVITFSEDLDSTTFATGKNGFSVVGGTLTSAALTDTNQVTLTGTNFTVNTDINYTSVFGLTDANSNALANIARTTVLE